MTTDKSSSVLRTALVGLAGAAGGFLLAALVLTGGPFGAPDGPNAGEKTAVDGQLWSCGMHPQVMESEPGQCPICGMNLVPLAGGPLAGEPAGGHEDHGHAAGAELWTCPMHPDILEPQPGRCPICGMDLVASADRGDAEEVAAGGGDGSASIHQPVRIDPAVVQNMNVRTETVERRDLSQSIRTVGYLDYDQERMVTVTTKYSGWVEKVYVNYIGERVRKGQPLFEVYSPELVQTAQELLSALRFARDMRDAPEDSRQRAESLVDSARVRLGYWDISPEQIARLEETGEVFRTLTVTAPASGLVMKRMPGLEGMGVKPGMEIFHIANLSSLWLTVEIFEDQMAWVREGTPAEVALTYFPGETFRGTVRFLEPELSEKTRTLRVKIEVKNPRGRLRKGMFATVNFEPVAVEGAIVVPSQAVLRTGRRNVVVVALGEGRFAPREVVIGHEAEGYTQILDGVAEGETLVTSAQFLLDSESKLREAIQKMIAVRGE